MKSNKEKFNQRKKIILSVLALIILISSAYFLIQKISNANLSQKKSNDETSTTEKEISENVNENTNETTKKTENIENVISTGKLSEKSTQYEGKRGTGDFNYGEALQKSILFYEMQRSGDLPENSRCNWRGDSALNDGLDVGLDLTGGFYDAGDHVKFNLPMAYTSSMLAWSVYEDYDSYKESNQLDYILDNIKWVNDYLIKCHPEENVFYYQVGDGNKDHAWWGPCEVMQMERPSFKVDLQNPGSAVSAQASASLAACSVIFKDIDKEYSKKCLEYSKSLFDFAEKTKSDEGYTAANGFYNSWSGFYDELSWSAIWLYIATNDKDYLKKSDEYLDLSAGNYKWAHCWDDVYIGSALLLAQQTEDEKYKQIMEKHLDFWTDGYDGEKISYTPEGLAWLDQWGSLRYAATESFIANLYSELKICSKDKKDIYHDFAVSQINYALGSTGRSFVVGFGENPPQNPHHRTAQGSWSNNMNEPSEARHTLYGALVGGPDKTDSYSDDVSNYVNNEVACDYNAGFVAALAKLYKKYGGQTLVDFGAVEEIDEEELNVMSSQNANGSDFTEIKSVIYNKTGWPARVTENLELLYFIDLSEVFEAGGSENDIEVSINYSQDSVKSSIKAWNAEKNIYCVSIDFSGVKIYPGGQDAHKKEVQFRIKSNNGTWNPENDYSYADISNSNGSSLATSSNMALYENGKIVFGSEPDGKAVSIPTENKKPTEQDDKKVTTTKTTTVPKEISFEEGDLKLEVSNQNSSNSSNTMSFNISITNTGDSQIPLSSMNLLYYFNADGASKENLVFWCDHSSTISNSSYNKISDISGTFSNISNDNADTFCTISSTDKTVLNKNDKWEIQARITKSDWSDFKLNNDYSAETVKNIIIQLNNKTVFGNELK